MSDTETRYRVVVTVFQTWETEQAVRTQSHRAETAS